MERAIELPNKEQRAKSEYVKSSTGPVRRKYATVLEKYFGTGTLDKDQYQAGDRLYQEAYHGGVLSQIKAMDPTRAQMPKDRSYFNSSQMPTEQAYLHKAWSDAFFNQRLGNIQRDVLWWVCICDNEITHFSKNRDYSAGLLRESLNELARYYKSLPSQQRS